MLADAAPPAFPDGTVPILAQVFSKKNTFCAGKAAIKARFVLDNQHKSHTFAFKSIPLC